MAASEGVVYVGHVESNRGGLAGREGFGALEAVAVLAAERLAADELLVAAHPNQVRRDGGAPPGPGRRGGAGGNGNPVGAENSGPPRGLDRETDFYRAGRDEI